MRIRFRALAVFALAAALLTAPPAETAVQDSIPHKRFLSPRDQDVAEFQLAGNDRGDQLVSWQDYGTRDQIRVWMRVRSRGEPFGRVRPLTPKRTSAFLQAADMGPDGAAVLVWTEYRRDEASLEVAVRAGGGSFAPPKALARRNVGDVDAAVAGDGTMIAAWTDFAGGSTRVRAAVRETHGHWSRPKTVVKSRRGKGSLDVDLDADGDATLIWVAGGRPSQIRTASRPARGRFGRTRAISDPRRSARDALLAQNARGDAIALWRAPIDDEHDRLGYSVRRAGAQFGPSHWLTGKIEYVEAGGAAVDPSGTATVVWTRTPRRFEGPCLCYAVVAARRPLGGEFGKRRRLGGDAESTASIGADSRGNVVAAWPAVSGPREHEVISVAGRFLSATGELGPRRRLSRPGSIFDPRSLLTRDGRALVAWIGFGNGHERLAAARARVAPPRIGPAVK